jgi:uncharacterized membrane protein YesL
MEVIMGNKKDFGDGIVFTIINYIWWFLLANFYFWIMNIPLVFVFIATNGNAKLNLLLIISALPIGPALTALFSIMGKLIREKDLNITTDFFKAYKVNFFESLFFWTLQIIVISILYLDKMYLNSTMPLPWLEAALSVFIIMCLAMNFYIFPIISRFSFKKFYIIKLSAYYLVKRFYICLSALAVIYFGWISLNKGFAFILLFFLSILCYIVMLLQRKTLYEIEKNLQN